MLIGPMYDTPVAPNGIKSVSAASGPYAAEPRASRPSIGTPAITPTRCSPSSYVASGRPNK